MNRFINHPFCFLIIYFFIFISQEFRNKYFYEKIVGTNYYGEYKSHNYYDYLDDIGKEIMFRVDNSEKIIFLPKENTPFCKTNPGYAGYVNFPKRSGTDFGICTFRIIESQDFQTSSFLVNNVVRHEGMHVAQFCNKPGFNKPAIYPLNITNSSNLLKYKSEIESDIYTGIPENQKLAELEAFYAEDKPYLISELISAYCYKGSKL